MSRTTHKELKDVLISARENKISLNIIGETGNGKTEGIKEVYENLGLRTIVIHIGQMADATAIEGIYYPDEQTKKVKALLFDLLPQTEENGVIIFDEWNRVGSCREIINFLFQLILEYKTNTWTVPKGWSFVFLGNPPSDKYPDVYDWRENKALTARLCHVLFDITPEDVIKYFRRKNASISTMLFLKNFSDIYIHNVEDFDFSIQVSPRSIKMLDEIVQSGTPHNVISVFAGGLLGPANAAVYMQTLADSLATSVSFDEFYNEYDEVRGKIVNMSDYNNNLTDRLGFLMEEIASKLTLNNFTKQLIPQMLDFIKIIPMEMKYVLYSKIIKGMINNMILENKSDDEINNSVPYLMLSSQEFKDYMSEIKMHSTISDINQKVGSL